VAAHVDLDVAHNPAAARVLAANLQQLRDQTAGAGRTLAVCGILADKDAAGVAGELRDCVDAWWCTGTEGGARQSGAELARSVRSRVAAPVEVADSVAAACEAVSVVAGAGDRIIVFGSFHTVGPALDWLEAHDLLPPAPLPEYTAAPRGT